MFLWMGEVDQEGRCEGSRGVVALRTLVALAEGSGCPWLCQRRSEKLDCVLRMYRDPSNRRCGWEGPAVHVARVSEVDMESAGRGVEWVGVVEGNPQEHR